MGLGLLGFAPDRFWDLSLPEFQCALRGYEQRRKEGYWQAGTIAAAIYNVNRKEGAEPFDAVDIFPFLLTEEEKMAREFARIESHLLPDDEEDS